MDASDRTGTRRDSVSHAQPVVHDSPNRRHTARKDVVKSDNLDDSVEVATQAAIASAVEPIDQDQTPAGPQAYAFEERKHVSSLARKRSRSKSHRPRQSSRSESTHSVPVSSFSKATVPLTDSDIDQQLLVVLKQEVCEEDSDMAISYSQASLQPPVTADSLSELDIARIINNPKLRHDVNFDKELHFRPNLDGSRGKQKLRAADDFWKALVAELVLYKAIGAKLMACTTTQDAEYWTRMMASSQRRLPVMFETIRDVLKTLVPERDQSTIAERLDVGMIMQEISRGLFDMMSLAKWLSTLLKAHCAPMRDDWIDQMVAQVQKGVNADCQMLLVNGLRQLLAILEAMKLDVANHQIRHLRVLLIEDGVAFQQKFHVSRMQYGRFDATRARKWYLREYTRQVNLYRRPDRVRIYVALLLKSLLSHHLSLPETFYLDMDRLRMIRTDLHNHIYTKICADVFDSILSRKVTDDVRNKSRAAFIATLPSLVGESRKFSDCAGNITVEVVRQALDAERSTERFDAARTELAEKRLKSELTASSFHFGRHARQLYHDHATDLEKLLRENLPITPVTLHDRMFAHLPVQQPVGVVAPPPDKSLHAILGRLCHVAVLHWHIWSPLIYIAAESTVTTVVNEPVVNDNEGSTSAGPSDTESEAGSDVSEAMIHSPEATTND